MVNAAVTITYDTLVGAGGLPFNTTLLPTIILTVSMVFSSESSVLHLMLFLQLLLGYLKPLDLCFQVQHPLRSSALISVK